MLVKNIFVFNFLERLPCKKRIWNPARIPPQTPPQTPPASGEGAEAGRIHIPRQIVSPCRVRINFQDFRKKMFELRPENTANSSFKIPVFYSSYPKPFFLHKSHQP